MAAVTHAAEMTVNLTGEIYGGLFKMVRNPRGIRRQLGGPIAIAQLSAKQARKGLDSILNFIAVISVMLAVVNLLPIPILDGGMVLFSIVEGIRREPLSLKSQLILQRIGFAFLVSLMAFSLVNDIGRVWKRHKAIDKPVETSTVIDDSTDSD
jgi:regulator of sigma E protease